MQYLAGNRRHRMSNRNSSFHIQLLAQTIDIQKFPLTKLIIDHHVTEEEYEALFHMLQQLEKQYEIQKEEGFVDFTSLLVHFAGMLTRKLHPNQTIYALKKEGYYPSLMNEFIQLIEHAADGSS